MQTILALDQGTTSSRALLFDAHGQIRGIAQEEFAQSFPRPGWVEHDPEVIWRSQADVAQRVIADSGLGWDDIAGVGLSNQRETTVVWERESGTPIYPAIVWQDRRTAPLCETLRERGLENLFRHRTGLLLDPYFAGTKVRWLLDNVPGAQRRAEAGELAFGTIDTWLVWRLTGGRMHVTDVSNASRTLLFNIHRLDWDDELLDALGVPRALLPEVRTSSEIYGHLDCAELPGQAPLAGMAGDQHAALFGQMCDQPGMVKSTYGTGAFVLMNTGRRPAPSRHNLLSTIGWSTPAETQYALEGSVFMAGAVIQWLRDGLGIIRDSAEVEALAASVPDNGGVYLVPAFAGLGAPHWDPEARGTIVGLTRGATRAHLARAALEAIAFQVADVVDAMTQDTGLAVPELRVDGGATANDLLMQFQADLLGVPVLRPAVTETTALGAAYLAGLAVGFWPDSRALARQWRVEKRFEPQLPGDATTALKADWKRAVATARAWAHEA